MLKFVRTIIMLAALTATAAIASACGSGADAVNNANKQAISEMPAAFKNNCISCHGLELEGVAGQNTNLQHVGARMSKDDIIQQIRQGGRVMPEFASKLTEQEINEIADWLSSMN